MGECRRPLPLTVAGAVVAVTLTGIDEAAFVVVATASRMASLVC